MTLKDLRSKFKDKHSRSLIKKVKAILINNPSMEEINEDRRNKIFYETHSNYVDAAKTIGLKRTSKIFDDCINIFLSDNYIKNNHTYLDIKEKLFELLCKLLDDFKERNIKSKIKKLIKNLFARKRIFTVMFLVKNIDIGGSEFRFDKNCKFIRIDASFVNDNMLEIHNSELLNKTAALVSVRSVTERKAIEKAKKYVTFILDSINFLVISRKRMFSDFMVYYADIEERFVFRRSNHNVMVKCGSNRSFTSSISGHQQPLNINLEYSAIKENLNFLLKIFNGDLNNLDIIPLLKFVSLLGNSLRKKDLDNFSYLNAITGLEILFLKDSHEPKRHTLSNRIPMLFFNKNKSMLLKDRKSMKRNIQLFYKTRNGFVHGGIDIDYGLILSLIVHCYIIFNEYVEFKKIFKTKNSILSELDFISLGKDHPLS